MKTFRLLLSGTEVTFCTVQVGVSKDLYAALEARAQSEGKSVAHIASEAIRGLVQ